MGIALGASLGGGFGVDDVGTETIGRSVCAEPELVVFAHETVENSTHRTRIWRMSRTVGFIGVPS